jgi:hypothetical protein
MIPEYQLKLWKGEVLHSESRREAEDKKTYYTPEE